MPTHTGVTLNPASATFYDDTYVQFTATAHYDDGTSYTLPWFETVFTSSNPSVAAVTSNTAIWGRVYGIATGTATLTVRMTGHPVDDPLYGATAAITVTAPPPPPPPPSARFSLAFDAALHDPYPTWTPIDQHPNLVTTISIDRGRAYELDQTDAGRATVQIRDPDGILDPTNPTGPHYGQIRPLLQAAICRRNPVTGAWEDRYHGYVDDYSYDVDPSQRVNQLTISLVDVFEPLQATEMQPGTFGYTLGGQVIYDFVDPDTRIAAILQDAGFARRSFVTLPGSVGLSRGTYSPGESAMTAIQDAADGEFPNVANVYADRHGRLCFHGRNARFDPSGTAAAAGDDVWDYHHWKAGDGATVNASPSDTAQVRALGFQRGLSKIINTALALPAGAPDGAELTARVIDTASVNTYGIRPWSASNLFTAGGDLDATYATSAMTETRRFAQYYVANYAQPRDRINGITFRSLHPDDPRAAANWDLLTRIDIGDTIEITVHTHGGGGFTAEQYFVEGIHEDVRPLAPGYDDVTLTLDLSPRSYYTFDPWATPLSAPDPSTLDPDDNPPKRSRKPRPTVHSRDHEHDGPDPIRLHYEKVGTGPGEGGVGGIQFDTDPQVGGFLEITTTDNEPNGIRLAAESGGMVDISADVFINLISDGDGGIALETRGNGDLILAALASSGIQLQLTSPARLRLTGLPTSAPTGSNVVWRDAGVLKIT